MLKRTIALAMVACLAGCAANDSGPGDEEEIAGVVRKLSSEEHQSEVCRTLFTQRLVRAIWGTQARCLRENADSDDDGRDSTRARDSQVHGDRATARVTTRVMAARWPGRSSSFGKRGPGAWTSSV